MIEGLLLLDENGRIQLANRAFAGLFDITTPVRGKNDPRGAPPDRTGANWFKASRRKKQLLGHEFRLAGLSERWLQINAAAISDGTAKRRGTILSSTI